MESEYDDALVFLEFINEAWIDGDLENMKAQFTTEQVGRELLKLQEWVLARKAMNQPHPETCPCAECT